MQRVQKLMKEYCSRRKAEELIIQGRVRVNGKKITIGDKAEEKDKISVDGKTIIQEKKIYLMLNKPLHCVTTLKDEQHRTIMHYVKVKERVFPIGRLDCNTSGLLLLTNDGDFANKIMHPRHEIKKTYLVESTLPLDQRDIKSIKGGILLEDGRTSSAHVDLISDTLLELTIHEGKNRIIKRIMKAIGYSVKSLKRIKIGG